MICFFQPPQKSVIATEVDHSLSEQAVSLLRTAVLCLAYSSTP